MQIKLGCDADSDTTYRNLEIIFLQAVQLLLVIDDDALQTFLAKLPLVYCLFDRALRVGLGTHVEW